MFYNRYGEAIHRIFFAVEHLVSEIKFCIAPYLSDWFWRHGIGWFWRHGISWSEKAQKGNNMSVLKTENLSKQYGQKETAVLALENANISVERGEFVAIVGTSGSGKSTLLHMLGGLDRPTAGKVFIDGKDVFGMKDEELTIFRRRKIGFVFQAFNLVSTLNVYENIVFPIQLDGNDVDEAFVDEVIRMLGLTDLKDRLPGNLSGGQQQRVAIARALSTKPAIILADEPTGNLDSKTSADVLSLLKVSSQKFNQTIVMITHNEAIAQMADRVIRIEDGHIVKGGDASHE